MSQSLSYVEIDVDYCSLTYSVAPCQAHLGSVVGTPPAVLFDGVNDYLTRGAGLTGAADSKQLTFSCWVNLATSVPGFLIEAVTSVGGGTDRTSCVISNLFSMLAYNAAGTLIGQISSSSIIPVGQWVHILASFDLTDTAKRHIYIDDVSDILAGTYTNDTIDFTMADWAVGALANGTTKLATKLADLWFAPGVYIDFSVASNRRKFITADKKPVALGADGSTPTGSAPLVFLGNPAASWHTNLGSGGGFTLHGSLDASAFTSGTRKCFNTIVTCQDRADFTNDPVTLRFAVDTDYLPKDIECIPDIKGISFTPATLSLGKDLGQRATVKVTFTDHPHSDTGAGGDKYLSERPYDPWSQGTFWGKFRARQPFLRGRPMRVIRGLLGDAIGDMDTRHYVIESFDGPSPDGEYSISAKDLLKLADGDRAQAPVLNNGFLLADITDVAVTATLSPTGIGNLEYPASGYLNIGGKEIVSFTRSGDVLTIVRGQLNTVASTHSLQDRVQLCLRYIAQDPGNIIENLLEQYAGVPSYYMPIGSWNVETANYLNRLYTATIAEPTSVNALISELIEQAGLVVWWDDAQQLIRLQVLRAITTTADRYTQDNVMVDSLDVAEQPDKRVSRVWTYFGQINPLLRLDQLENFRSTAETFDATAEDDYGGQAIKKIFSRWIPDGGRAIALRINDIQIARFRDPPRRFTFDVFRYAGQVPQLGGGYNLAAWPFQDDTGAEADVPIQITRLNPDADRYKLEAEEMLFFGGAATTDHVIIFDGSVNDVNLRTVHDTLYPTPVSGDVVRCIVQSGVIIGSSSTASPAFHTGSWPGGVAITLQVQGRIEGHGGLGGDGSTAFVGGNATPGQGGGIALYTRTAINLEITSEIWGGGGGGGGGNYPSPGADGAGGGGGAGQLPGSGGARGILLPTSGTTEAGGSPGGDGFNYAGAGGGPGLSGANSPTGPAGGAAGAAVDGISFVTVTVGPGDRRGGEIN